jgi:hypothetical protein
LSAADLTRTLPINWHGENKEHLHKEKLNDFLPPQGKLLILINIWPRLHDVYTAGQNAPLNVLWFFAEDALDPLGCIRE